MLCNAGVVPTMLEALKNDFALNISVRDYFASAQSREVSHVCVCV